jgi:myosin heavy subunit
MAIIEAFGHANNGVNRNSTRFAKFIELKYTLSGKLESGSSIFFNSFFLLEIF